jgi:hypothetical protein
MAAAAAVDWYDFATLSWDGISIGKKVRTDEE